MKKIISLFTSIIIIMSLTACKSELHQNIIIYGFGIDKIDEGYQLTVRYATLDESNPEEILTVSGQTVYDAMSKISLSSGKKPLFSSASFIIYGSDVAKDGIDKALDFFVRYFKSKPIINMFIAQNTASEILGAKKDDKLIPSNLIEESTGNEENIGKTISCTVMDFINDVKSESGASLVPIVKLQDNEYTSTTTAVFDEFKMTEILRENETKGYLASVGKLCMNSIIVELEDEKISIEIQNIKSEIESNLKDEPIFTIKLQVDATITAMPFSINQVDYDTVEQKATQKVEEFINSSVKKLKSSNVDYFGFSKILYLKEREYWKENSDTFSVKMSEIKININTNIIRTGEEN